MLARGALCRLAAEVPKQATHDLPKLATLIQTARSGFSLPSRTLAHVSQLQTRSYATTKAAKDPAAPVKKAIKAKAAAGKKVTKTTTTKKVAARKPKKTAKKATPKKPVKKPKKVLTDEEKLKAQISQLRKTALKEPVTRHRLSAFQVYVAENAKGEKGSTATFTEIVKAFKDITPAEREKFNHLATERNEANIAEYHAWVKTHTVNEIRLANNARKLLRRKLAGKTKGTPAYTKPIEDDRQVKLPTSAWNFFFAERQASPDFQGIAVPERAKLISAEWKALNASEKQRFQDQAEADKQRFTREKSV
ncbi:hypothetical protein E8E11_010228 [Didymella keratinophila]|nr:hypothetical protein E8E11_010228 [Didymella keratinophila]